jgi:Predicted dioxygenase
MEITNIYDLVYRLNITACGIGPIAATITASRILGASSGKLLRYATSGETTGDFSQVVGYGALVFT